MQIRDCQEQRRTLRARRHALRIHELIRLHVRLPESYGILPESMNTLRSAAHSDIAIFRSAAKGSDRQDLMENPGFNVQINYHRQILQQSRIHSFVQTHSDASSDVETQARKDRAFKRVTPRIEPTRPGSLEDHYLAKGVPGPINTGLTEIHHQDTM